MTPTERRQRITDVCEHARQLPPGDRDDFVEGQCGGDRQLLQEVKSALSEFREPDKVEDAVAIAVGQPPPAPPPPSHIGRYEITGEIGSGGTGQVYSALDRNVGRVVAIKVLTAPGDADLVRRFEAEAKTVANLHHKNIVTLHEYGQENGVPYLVMEYLNGTTLQELIRQRSLSLLEKLEIMSEVAEGLHYAHECGITHRDVKPANIMQLTDGSVKIMDFGIARLAAESTTRLTQTGLLIGSIMYMAPEQFGGTADAMTDVFSYGVTFYELLTGKNPFNAADPVVVIFRIANTDPPPVHSVVPECPAALDQIMSRMLARNRNERYSNLWDVLADTRGILSDLRRDQGYKLFMDAGSLFAAGRLDAAKAAVRKALELDPAPEDARKLRSEIEEALRRRDAGARVEALMDQAEKAVQAHQYEGAGGILDSIRDMRFADPKLQGRFDWAAAQVEQARRRDRLLTEARRELRKENVTQAFRAVSEVLAEDPGNNPGKELLQEIRKEMAATEARHHLQEEAARAEGLLAAGETDQALLVLAEVERQDPEFAPAAILRARAEAQKSREARARRFSEGSAEVKDLLKNGHFDQAVTRIDELAIDFPDSDSPEYHELSALRAKAPERPAAGPGGAPAPSAQDAAVPEDAPEGAALEEWRKAIGKLDEALGPAPEQPFATERELSVPTERELPTVLLVPDQREQAIVEILAKVQSLEVGAQYTEAAGLLEAGLREHGPDPRLLEAQQRVLPQIQQHRERRPRPRRSRLAAILIVLDVIALSILALLYLLRPQLSFLPWYRPAVESKLSIDQPPGLRTVVRGEDLSIDLRASGASLPLSWDIADGDLPPGLSLNSTTGRIQGAPSTSGIFMFLARTADKAGHSAQRVITVEVVDPTADLQHPSTGAKSSANPGQLAAGGTLHKNPSEGAVASNAPSCAANNFNLDRYGDLLTGELIWTGTLSAGERVNIQNLRASSGSVQGDILPKGVPVRVSVTAANIRVITEPTAKNCWDPRVLLLNLGSPQSEIRIKWAVYQP